MRYNQLYIAGVHPGYDDTNVREGNEPFKREDGDYYKSRWEDAISMNPDWITITSWNEWHEGTEIEPSEEHGDKALEQTKDYIKEFKSGDPKRDVRTTWTQRCREINPDANTGYFNETDKR